VIEQGMIGMFRQVIGSITRASPGGVLLASLALPAMHQSTDRPTDNLVDLVGDGTRLDRVAPTLVKGLRGIVAISGFSSENCAIARDGA